MSDICSNIYNELNTKVLMKDTMVNSWSPEQIILSLTILMLTSRGYLNMNEKVSKYWPNYITKGGKDTEVRHLLSRRSGIFGCDDLVTVEDVSELVRQTDGRSLTQFVVEELSGYLRADPYLGVVDEVGQEGRPRIRLRSSVNGSAVPRTRTGYAQNGISGSDEPTNPRKLYPESIPPHSLHPCSHDFSVVDQSPIGKALLTHRYWQQGDFMARFDGVTVPEVMLHTLQKTAGVHLWDPHFVGILTHSCNPNVMLDMAENEMWAIQDIEPGAVLTMDYASTEDHLFRTFQCQCNASGCRGEVTGRKQRRGGCASVDPKST